MKKNSAATEVTQAKAVACINPVKKKGRAAGKRTWRNNGGQVAVAGELDGMGGEGLVHQRADGGVGHRVPFEGVAALGQFGLQPALLFQRVVGLGQMQLAHRIGVDHRDAHDLAVIGMRAGGGREQQRRCTGEPLDGFPQGHEAASPEGRAARLRQINSLVYR
ncbi:MAG: hypothetical protein PW843_27195 [Azospirillaceae bacterium]|nr:hypothetical protein [Azospirillaceae bacterium]